MRYPKDIPAEHRTAYARGFHDGQRANGRKGAAARAASMTPERRSEIARMGAIAKAAKQAARKSGDSA